LAGLPAGHAIRAAVGVGKRIGGRPAEIVTAEVQARTAAQLFQVLGELKGGALKLGQAMSAMEALLPAELADPYRDALTRLQEAAPPLPADTVHQVLAESIGADWRARFRTFDEQPVAAASIGQVHRGRWHDGADVAVKVQYPGVADALSADLRQLDRALPFMRLGAPALDARSLLDNLRDRLVDELDYLREADAQHAFATAYAGDPDIFVPQVIEARDRILITAWVDGTPLARVISSGTEAERSRAGGHLVRLFLASPSRVGRIHGDPHPGNFRLLDDGRLAVLDFGSTEPLAAGWPPGLGRLIRAGRDRDATSLHREAVASGLLRPDDVSAADLLKVLDPWFEPLRTEGFHFGRSWLQREARVWSNPRSTASRIQRKARVPAHHVLVQRVAFGLLGVLTSLNATVGIRAEAERWIPELAL
jgi:predicted unusual protein kinase regulating ubiquinone biosynthesis (AarF/ABC1/UbiB family)